MQSRAAAAARETGQMRRMKIMEMVIRGAERKCETEIGNEVDIEIKIEIAIETEIGKETGIETETETGIGKGRATRISIDRRIRRKTATEIVTVLKSLLLQLAKVVTKRMMIYCRLVGCVLEFALKLYRRR
jgi:hypothetical protein